MYSQKWLPKRIAVSSRSLGRLLYFTPQYMLLALGVSVVFYELVFWFLNMGLAQYLFTTPYLSFADKFDLIVGSYVGVFSPPFSKLSTTLFLVSVFQGISVAGLTFILRHRRSTDKSFIKELGGTGVAGVLSVLGLGCAACGTSLILPIVSIFFASTSLALIDTIGFYAMVVALVISVISAYVVGLKVAVVQSQ